jgi:restriction system protein
LPMARRKSLFAQLYEARQKAKIQQQKAEEQARQAWAAEERRAEAQAAKEEAAARREEQRADRARQQQETEAARRAIAQEREAARQAATTAREARERAAAAQRATVERRIAEAEFRSSAVQATLAAFDRLLTDRSRNFATLSRHVEEAFNAEGPEALVDTIQKALATSLYPEGLEGSCAAKYIPEAAELWVEYELPRQKVIPPATGFKYVKAQDKIVPALRKQSDSDKLYEKLIARLALRTLAEAFDAAPVTLVTGIVFNGYVSDKDRGTGQSIRPLLLSVHADREAFSSIVLDEPELDPTVCLRGYLNAVMSPHPWDLEAVKPVVQFDLSRYKFVDEMSVAARLDSRPELLALKPVEFEHLIRELFEAIGLKSWVTRSSKDEGVDGVAINEDPIVGGLCIIQAKRYSKIVDLESVHALAGVMDDMNAAKGVLVTTSWVGKASRDFASRNGNRIQIIEGRELKHLLLEHLGIDALISLPKLPPGWDQRDLT